MWVPFAPRNREASSCCWAPDGLATTPPPPTTPADPAAEGAGVLASTGTGGGTTVALLRPTRPISTAAKTPAPSSASEHASSHALRSDGGVGKWTEASGRTSTGAPPGDATGSSIDMWLPHVSLACLLGASANPSNDRVVRSSGGLAGT